MADRVVVKENGNGMWNFLGILVLVIFVIVLLYYGLPYLRSAMQQGGTQINVPDKVDVNIYQNP